MRNQDPKYVDQPRSRDETGEIAETPSFSQDPSPVPVRSIRSESTYVARDDLAHSPQTRAAPLTRSDLDDIGEIRSLSQNYQETRYHQVLNRLTHYMSLYEEAKQEVSRLKNTLRDIDSAKGVPENWLSMLAESRNHVSVLKQQGADRSALKKLFACKELTAENYEDRDIVSSFELLQGSLKRIQILGGDTKLRIADVCNVSKDLDELLSITFGTDSRDFSQEKVDLGPELSLYDIIQALVGAAIHSWIFSTEYCPFAITPVPLLQEYRRQISAICEYVHLHIYNTDLQQTDLRRCTILIMRHIDFC